MSKKQFFTALKLTKHCNAQKFQKYTESAPGLAIDARILESPDFFEHYSVSWDGNVGIFLSITVFVDVQDRVCCITKEQ